MTTLGVFETRLGHTFAHPLLLETALTHRSFANESIEDIPDNQRLEFLGDAILGMVITEYLYETFPTFDEGALSKMKAQLVCENALAEVAQALNIGEFLRLGKGEESSGGREKISLLADAYEAIIAALQLDGDVETARRIILTHHQSLFATVTTPHALRNAKSTLQEWLQDTTGDRPRYHIANTTGPPHARNFTAHVYFGEDVVGVGLASSKKEAQRRAAVEALESLTPNTSQTLPPKKSRKTRRARRARSAKNREKDNAQTTSVATIQITLPIDNEDLNLS